MNTRVGFRRLLGALAVLLIAAPSAGHAATIIVPDDNPSIVAAVAGAAAGDTVLVRPGTYGEGAAVEVRQDALTVMGFGGRPVITGGNRKAGFRVRAADGVVISGFEIKGRLVGVRLDDATGARVDDLVVTDCGEGVRVRGGGSLPPTSVGGAFPLPGANVVENSTFTNMMDQGALQVDRSPGIVVSNNSITGVKKAGIRVASSDGSVMLSNTITGDRRGGIAINNSAYALLSANVVSNSGGSRAFGITGARSQQAFVSGNAALQNHRDGFALRSSGAFVLDNAAA